MEFLLLNVVHVAAAIVAVGTNVTFAIWMSRAHRDREHLVFVIETIRLLDRRLANPAYVVVLITGIVMVARGAYSFTTGWIAASIALYVVAVLVGILVFAPTIRRQLAEAKRDPSGPAYELLARATDRLTLVTILIVGTIVGLMVTKPFQARPRPAASLSPA